MKRILQQISLLFTILATLTSCLGDNTEEVVFYDDAAIINVGLGTLNNRQNTKTADGRDSVAVSKIEGSKYHFTIDQMKREIYNVDSLPYGTDITKVVTILTAKNSGSIVIKSMTSDSVKYHVQTDSVDFSQPRTFFVYSNSGKNHAEYTMKVNVHKQLANQFDWQRTAIGNTFATLTSIRAFEMNGKMYVVGSNGESSSIFSCDLNDCQVWTVGQPDINMLMPVDMTASMASDGKQLFITAEGHLLSTADGSHWTDNGQTSIARLIGSDGTRLYAIDSEGKIISSADNGQTWQTDPLDDSIELLPTREINIVAQPLLTNSDMQRVVMLGNRDARNYPDDAYAVVWSRLFDDSNNTVYPWMYYSQSPTARYQAPRLRSMTMLPYNNRLIAIGAQPLGACTTAAFSAIYESIDGGLTWKNSEHLTLPSDFVTVANTFCAAVDSNNFVWLINAETGEIWRARLTQLGWDNPQTEFRTRKK